MGTCATSPARPPHPFRRRCRRCPTPPKPKPTVRPETYSVVVNQVNVRELLFALARDAQGERRHPSRDHGIGHAERDRPDAAAAAQPRSAKQVDMRYELDGPNLVVMPDSPYLRIYKIDYVNMQRETTGQVTVSPAISPAGTPAGGGAGGGAARVAAAARPEHLDAFRCGTESRNGSGRRSSRTSRRSCARPTRSCPADVARRPRSPHRPRRNTAPARRGRSAGGGAAARAGDAARTSRSARRPQ